MKILVVSLLRLGDLIQQVPLLKGLIVQNPGAEIHLLVNRQFSQVEKILDGIVHTYHYFERDAIQKGLGEAEYNILWSYTQVENLVHQLNAERFDVVYNFTHNKLSAYLLGAIEVKEKRGLYHSHERFQGLTNRWLKYFNERFPSGQNSLFHYIELLANSFSIPISENELDYEQTKRRKIILFQCLTSDSKKNWGLANFSQLKLMIESHLVDYEVKILAAPFERSILLEVFKEKELLVGDLVEVRQHLQTAALLITGDTSIKHLAAQLNTPIVELALGSSDSSKTGAFSSRTNIIKTTVPCAPCVHSKPCVHSSHLCAEDISIEKVFESVWAQLSREATSDIDLLVHLDRAVWKLYLDKEHQQVEPFYRTEVEKLETMETAAGRAAAVTEWIEQGVVYKKWVDGIKRALPTRDFLAAKRNFQSADITDLIMCAQNILKSKMDRAGYFQSFVEALLSRFSQPVQIYDRVTAALLEVEEILMIRETLIRQMQTYSREGDFYAKGIGHLPFAGFEEAGKSVQRDLEDSGIYARNREVTTS